ncbi:MAG: PD-(D/E)XK nuclease family protein [Candidatus Sumerlaeaceae bacterium]|nr:PD-(D/E)XK nuclease family protein [Candidatus Sumerlaeaceae bacterium]
MISILHGERAEAARSEAFAALAAARGGGPVMVVVPTERWAREAQRRLAAAGGGVGPGAVARRSVVSWSVFGDAVAANVGAQSVGGAEIRILLRQVILEKPDRYPSLVRRHPESSEPFVTAGMLRRVASAVVRLLGETERPKSAPKAGSVPAQILELASMTDVRLGKVGRAPKRIAEVKAWRELTAVRWGRLFPGVERVVFSGFDVLDDLFVEAVAALERCGVAGEVLMPVPPDEAAQRFPHLVAAYGRLQGEVTVAGKVAGGGTARAGGGGSARPKVRLIRVANRDEEVRLMGAYLQEQIRGAESAGKRFVFEDYLVCFPSLERYAGRVESAFDDFGVECRFSTGADVTAQPLWQFLADVRSAVAGDLTCGSLLQLSRSPLLRTLTGEGLNEEVFVALRARLGGPDRGAAFLKRLRTFRGKLEKRIARLADSADEEDTKKRQSLQSELEAAGALEHGLALLMDSLAGLDGRRDLRTWGKDVLALLDTLLRGVPFLAEEGIRAVGVFRFGKTRWRIEQAIIELGQCSEILDGASVDFADYFALLEELLRGDKVMGTLPLTAGVGVVGRLEVRGLRPKVLLLGGLLEGEMPRAAPRGRGLLDDYLPEGKPREIELSEERFVFEQLITAPAEETILFVPKMDRDQELLESQFVTELLHGGRAVPVLQAEEFREEVSGAAGSVERQLLLGERAVGANEAVDDGGGGRNLPRVLHNAAWSIAADLERHRTDGLGVFDGFLSDSVLVSHLQERLKKQIHSPSELEVLVQCRHRHFIERILRLSEEDDDEEGLTPVKLGEIVHSVLFRFFSRWVAEESGLITATSRAAAWKILTKETEAQLDEQAVSDFDRDHLRGKLLGMGVPAGSGKDRIEIRGLPGIFGALLDLEIERSEANPEAAAPCLFEIGFGMGGRLQESEHDQMSDPNPVELKMGRETVRLRGRVDRVDLTDDAFSLVDYKTGAAPTIKAQLEGYRLQLPLYLLAIAELLKRRGERREPAGGVFYTLKQGEAKMAGQFFREEYRDAGAFGSRVRLLDDDKFEDAMDTITVNVELAIRDAWRGRFYVTTAPEATACGYCPWEGVCRKDLGRTKNLIAALREAEG